MRIRVIGFCRGCNEERVDMSLFVPAKPVVIILGMFSNFDPIFRAPCYNISYTNRRTRAYTPLRILNYFKSGRFNKREQLN